MAPFHFFMLLDLVDPVAHELFVTRLRPHQPRRPLPPPPVKENPPTEEQNVRKRDRQSKSDGESIERKRERAGKSAQELEDQVERLQERIRLVKERTARDSSLDSDYHRHRDRSLRPGACPTDDSEDEDRRKVSHRSRKKR